MVLPDLIEVQSDYSFCVGSYVSGDEVCPLGDTVDDLLVDNLASE
jgi:hypothetical protein